MCVYIYLYIQEESDIFTIVLKAITIFGVPQCNSKLVLIFTSKLKVIEAKNVSFLLISFKPILYAYAVS